MELLYACDDEKSFDVVRGKIYNVKKFYGDFDLVEDLDVNRVVLDKVKLVRDKLGDRRELIFLVDEVFLNFEGFDECCVSLRADFFDFFNVGSWDEFLRKFRGRRVRLFVVMAFNNGESVEFFEAGVNGVIEGGIEGVGDGGSEVEVDKRDGRVNGDVEVGSSVGGGVGSGIGGGVGFERVLVIDGWEKSLAQMSLKERELVDVRRMVVDKFLDYVVERGIEFGDSDGDSDGGSD